MRKSLAVVALLCVGCSSTLSRVEAEKLVKEAISDPADYQSQAQTLETTRDKYGGYDTRLDPRSPCADALASAKVATIVPPLYRGEEPRIKVLDRGKLRQDYIHFPCGERVLEGIESITSNGREARVRFIQVELKESACEEISRVCPTVLPKYNPGKSTMLAVFSRDDEGKWQNIGLHKVGGQ